MQTAGLAAGCVGQEAGAPRWLGFELDANGLLSLELLSIGQRLLKGHSGAHRIRPI
jgi:hypothetical protein